MKKQKNQIIFTVVFVAVSLCSISSLLAQSGYPTQPIEVVFPFNPGGGADISFRLYKDRVENILKQPIICNYKPGAGGMLATVFVKDTKQDGYTLVEASDSSLSIPPLTKKEAKYTLDDFSSVATLTRSPMILCVKQDSLYKTIQEFIEGAKKKKMTYSTTGTGSNPHIVMEAVSRAAGFQAIHIPYSAGGAASMTAVLGGHVDFSFCNPTGLERQLRVLAVGEDTRSELYPDLPNFRELGYPVGLTVYFTLWGPKGIPRDIVDKINRAFKGALDESGGEISKRARDMGYVAVVLSPEELRKVYQSNYDFLKEEVKRMGLAPK